jgi:FixJ family two-component response regulator
MQPQQQSKRATIVIIDNDEGMRHSLEWLIRSAGHDVLAYATGLHYLDDAVKAGRPDCIILDIHIPELNGVELYGILKTQYPDVPVIFITGYPDQAMAEKARALESNRFFTKPLDTDALLDCIDKAIIGTTLHCKASESDEAVEAKREPLLIIKVAR